MAPGACAASRCAELVTPARRCSRGHRTLDAPPPPARLFVCVACVCSACCASSLCLPLLPRCFAALRLCASGVPLLTPPSRTGRADITVGQTNEETTTPTAHDTHAHTGRTGRSH